MAATKVWVNILDILWPVGSLYYCVEDADPADVLGGTWVQQVNSTLTVGNWTYVCYTRVA